MALFSRELVVLAVTCCCLLPRIITGEDCVWNRDTDFPDFPSLLLNKGTWTSILPTLNGATREVRIGAGTQVVIACPESSISATNSDVVEGVCEGGDTLRVGQSNYNMMELGCQSRLKETVQKDLGPCGSTGSGGRNMIGFDITDYPFYNLVEVCFEPVLETTLYTNHVLRGDSAAASDGNPSRPGFKSDGFFSVSADNCYTVSSQESVVNESLGRTDVIDYDSSLYFARGHLSPDADFMTEMESDATYYYINAVPQWQVFNNGNWKYLEINTRDLASQHGTDLQVWTGTRGILALDDINNNPVQIFLGWAEQKAVIPAPDTMWKVIYEASTNRGVAVMGVNNPFLSSFPLTLCPDICDQIKWIDFEVADLEKGPVYCCSVQDFRSVEPNAPDLGQAGLLTE